MAKGKQKALNTKAKARAMAQKRAGTSKLGTPAKSTVKKAAKINALKRKRVQAGINRSISKK